MTDTKSTAAMVRAGHIMEQAGSRLLACWGIGIGLLVLGGMVAGVALPSTEVGTFGDIEQTGSAAWFAIGLILLGVGQIVALVAIIGTGVRLGIESARS